DRGPYTERPARGFLSLAASYCWLGLYDVEWSVQAGDQLNRDIHNISPQHRAAFVTQHFDDALLAERPAVRPRMDHGIDRIGAGDDLRLAQDFTILQAARISAAVQPLMVLVDDLRNRKLHLHRHQDVIAALGM